jgi:VIT1/CCC1 family predicted Fe2+/Mn2+ transporter
MAVPIHVKRMATVYILVLILVLLIVGLLYRVSSEWLIPSKETLHYLYSALFQGFAALVGLLLFLLGFIYQRGESLVVSLENAAYEKARFLTNIEDTKTIWKLKEKLDSWHESHYTERTDAFDATISRYSSGDRTEESCSILENQFSYLKMINDAYKEAAALIGRVDLERGRTRWLPAQLFIAVTPSVGVMFLSLLLLAFSDVVASQSEGTQRAFALVTIAAALLALGYIAYVITTMFMILFEGQDFWVSKSGLPDTKRTESLLSKTEAILRKESFTQSKPS